MKVMSPISAEEEDALRRILRHHEVSPERPLVDALAELISWVRQGEQAKGALDRRKAPTPIPMLSLLSRLGIYGGEAIGPSPQGGQHG